MGKGSFIIYDSDLKSIDYLTDAQVGKLFRAIKAHRLEDKTLSLGKNCALNMLYDQMMEHIAINEQKYKATCEMRSETMKKRWSEKKSTIVDNSALPSTIVKGSLLSDNDNDIDIDIVIDNENENENDIDIVNDNEACGAKRENKRKNYHNKNIPRLLQDNPSYDIEAFKQKTLELYRTHSKES